MPLLILPFPQTIRCARASGCTSTCAVPLANANSRPSLHNTHLPQPPPKKTPQALITQHTTWDDVEQQWIIAFRNKIPRGTQPPYASASRRPSRVASPGMPGSPQSVGSPGRAASPGGDLSSMVGAMSFRQTIGAAPMSRNMTMRVGSPPGGPVGPSGGVEGGALSRLATVKSKRHFT